MEPQELELLKKMQEDLHDMRESIQDIQRFLETYKKVKKVFQWFMMVTLTAAITTFTNIYIQNSMHPREVPDKETMKVQESSN